MSVHPSALDRRIELRRLVGLADAAGQVDEGAATVLGTVWASRRDLTDTEKARAAQAEVWVSTRFIMRASALTRSLGQGDMIADGDVVFDVKAVRDPYSDDPTQRRRWLEISAMARMRPGLDAWQ